MDSVREILQRSPPRRGAGDRGEPHYRPNNPFARNFGGLLPDGQPKVSETELNRSINRVIDAPARGSSVEAPSGRYVFPPLQSFSLPPEPSLDIRLGRPPTVQSTRGAGPASSPAGMGRSGRDQTSALASRTLVPANVFDLDQWDLDTFRPGFDAHTLMRRNGAALDDLASQGLAPRSEPPRTPQRSQARRAAGGRSTASPAPTRGRDSQPQPTETLDRDEESLDEAMDRMASEVLAWRLPPPEPRHGPSLPSRESPRRTLPVVRDQQIQSPAASKPPTGPRSKRSRKTPLGVGPGPQPKVSAPATPPESASGSAGSARPVRAVARASKAKVSAPAATEVPPSARKPPRPPKSAAEPTSTPQPASRSKPTTANQPANASQPATRSPAPASSMPNLPAPTSTRDLSSNPYHRALLDESAHLDSQILFLRAGIPCDPPMPTPDNPALELRILRMAQSHIRTRLAVYQLWRPESFVPNGILDPTSTAAVMSRDNPETLASLYALYACVRSLARTDPANAKPHISNSAGLSPTSSTAPSGSAAPSPSSSVNNTALHLTALDLFPPDPTTERHLAEHVLAIRALQRRCPSATKAFHALSEAQKKTYLAPESYVSRAAAASSTPPPAPNAASNLQTLMAKPQVPSQHNPQLPTALYVLCQSAALKANPYRVPSQQGGQSHYAELKDVPRKWLQEVLCGLDEGQGAARVASRLDVSGELVDRVRVRLRGLEGGRWKVGRDEVLPRVGGRAGGSGGAAGGSGAAAGAGGRGRGSG